MTVTAERSGVLDETGWEAARIFSGDLAPEDASPAALLLAARAADAATRDAMDDIVEAQRAAYTPSGMTGPRVSDYGACSRRVWYRESPPAGYVPDPVTIYERHAALGTIIHAAAAAARSARYPWRRYEFEVRVPGLDRPGRVDEYDPVTGEVVDNKTVGSRKWEWVGPDGPADEAWGQGFIYGAALSDMGLPVQTITIFVINRENGQEEHHHRPFDPETAQEYLDTLLSQAMMLDLGVEPPRERPGPSTDFECRVCPARGHCWDIPAATAAGRSPESWVKLGPSPDGMTIEWAGQEAIDANKARLQAEKKEDEARALIQGVTPGTYGDVRIVDSWGTSVDYKGAWAQMDGMYRTLYDMGALPEAAPDPRLMAGPRTRKTKTQTAKPLRKADIVARDKAKAARTKSPGA